MKSRPDFANLVLATEEDLDRGENYRIQTIKEGIHAMSSGYDPYTSTALYYYGIVASQDNLQFSGTEGIEITGGTFTVSSGNAFTRLKPGTDLTTVPQYEGGDRLGVAAALADVNIKHKTVSDVDNYIFLVHVELDTDKRFDETGTFFHFVHKQDSYVVVQLTEAEATTLGSFVGNPSGSVVASDVEATHLDSLLTSDEKTKTFGTWSSPGGIFTVGSITVNHYNSIFLGKIEVTDTATPKYKFYHTLLGTDALYGSFSRPSFSTVDQVHREQLGRGVPSDTNPHGLLIQDLDGMEANNEDHRDQLHTDGIYPKSAASALSCSINGTNDTVNVQQLAANEYLFLDGKRVTSIATISISFSAEGVGTYYIYVQPGTPGTSDTYPYDFYTGTLAKATSIPSDGFPLCSVYWDGTDAKAYDGDIRYSSGSATNPATDMRVLGNSSYSIIGSDYDQAIANDSVVPNGDFVLREGSTISGWENGTVGTILSQSGDNCLKVAAGNSDSSLLFPINLLQDYSLEYLAHTEGGSCTYKISVIAYRGRYKTLDEVGSFDIKSETGATYSSWTAVNAELLTTDVFLDDISNPVDDSLINWSAISIEVSAGNLNLNKLRFKPKETNISLSDDSVTSTKIVDGSIRKGHLDGTTSTVSIAALVDGSQTTLHTHAGVNAKANAFAWVYWEMVSGVVVPNADSYNISSVVETATAKYTVTFSSPAPHLNYAAVGMCRHGEQMGEQVSTPNRNVAFVRLHTDVSYWGTTRRSTMNSVVIFV